MYIDLIVLIILMVLVIVFYKRFTSFVFFMAIVDILLRILTFIRDNIGLKDVSDLIGKYVPGSIFNIIDKYTKGSINILLSDIKSNNIDKLPIKDPIIILYNLVCSFNIYLVP